MFKIRQLVWVVLLLAKGIFKILQETSDFKRLEEEVGGLVQQATSQMLYHALEEIDQKLLAQREESLRVVGKRQRTLVTSAGEITIQRRIYRQRDGTYRFLLDEALGLESHRRISPRMQEMASELATEVPFRRAAEILNYLVPGVNSMSVWNAVQEAGERAYQEAEKLKKSVFEYGEGPEGEEAAQQLYIEGDEVHLKQQRGAKKGMGLKLIVGYEGKDNSRLQNRYSVAGVASGPEIWDEASCYFGCKWSLSQVEKIRIGGDGADWIKQGVEQFSHASYHLDPFHLRRRLTEALSFSSSAYQKVCEGIAELDRVATMEALDQALLRVKGARKKRVKELKTYLQDNWEGIVQLPEEERMGAIEGQVRHTITRRMKRIGARWTQEGANRMGRLLAAKSNGELSNYVNNPEISLGDLVDLEKPIKEEAVKEKDIEEELRGSMPALKGPHASRFWVKHVLKELASIQ